MTQTAQAPRSNQLQIFGITLSLKSLVNHLENAIIIISGPAIAISGIIAGIDLLTGGSMFKDVAWLSLTWAICLLLTLDFQVLVLGARAKETYDSSKKSGKRKFCEILIIILIAAGISSVSVQMQSIIARTQATTTYTDKAGQQHTRNLTIDEATRDMGINPVALIWERSALVLVLIFMSGWFRDESERSEEAPSATATVAAAPPTSSISEADMQRILAALSEVASLKDELHQLRTPVQVQEIAAPTNTVIPEQAESKTPAMEEDEEREQKDKLELTIQFLREHPERANAEDIDAQLMPILGLKRAASVSFWRIKAQEIMQATAEKEAANASEQGARMRILAYIQSHEPATQKEIATTLNISERTVRRHLAAMRKSGQLPANWMEDRTVESGQDSGHDLDEKADRTAAITSLENRPKGRRTEVVSSPESDLEEDRTADNVLRLRVVK